MNWKIPFYDVLNMFFVGAIFCIGCFIIAFDKISLLLTNSAMISIAENYSVITTAVSVIAMYEIGFIINRIGAICMEPILAITKVVTFKKYSISFSDAKKDNAVLEAISREYVLCRSQIVLFLILLLECIFFHKWVILIGCILLIAIFVLSCRRYSKQTHVHVDAYLKKSKNSKDRAD